MNNYEKIKNMSIDEMATFVLKNNLINYTKAPFCKDCFIKNKDTCTDCKWCLYSHCALKIEQWLQEESE